MNRIKEYWIFSKQNRWKILKAEIPVITFFLILLPMITAALIVTFSSDKNIYVIVRWSSSFILAFLYLVIIGKVVVWLNDLADKKIKQSEEC